MKNPIKLIILTFFGVIISISINVNINSLYYFSKSEKEMFFFEIEQICHQKPPKSESTSLLGGFCASFFKCQPSFTSYLSENSYSGFKTKKRVKVDSRFLEIKKTELPLLELIA